MLISDIKVLYFTGLVPSCTADTHKASRLFYSEGFAPLGGTRLSRSGSESVASFKSALKLISNGLFSFDEVTSDMFYFQVFSCIFFFSFLVI